MIGIKLRQARENNNGELGDPIILEVNKSLVIYHGESPVNFKVSRIELSGGEIVVTFNKGF